MRDMPNLDFVRSVAVLSVVLEHILLALHIVEIGPFPVGLFGVLGVLVFFVLTALVLMWSMERKPYALDFYIRRVFRIYPLAWAAIGIALIFHAPVAGDPKVFFQFHPMTVRDKLLQLPLPNQVMDVPLVVSPLWSLSYEILMYVFLPVVFFFTRRNFVLWPLLFQWAVIFLRVRHANPHAPSLAMVACYFLPGIMAYVGFGLWRPRLPAWLLPVFLTCLWTLFWYHASFRRGVWFCLALGLMLPLFRQFRARWILVPSHHIAKYSYGIYLMHPFALVLGLYLLRSSSVPVRILGVAVPLVALPILAYHLLERPAIRLGSRIAARAERFYEKHEDQVLHQSPQG